MMKLPTEQTGFLIVHVCAYTALNYFFLHKVHLHVLKIKKSIHGTISRRRLLLLSSEQECVSCTVLVFFLYRLCFKRGYFFLQV